MTSPVFVPMMNVITNVTNGVDPTVTTLTSHGYITGNTVFINIPVIYGMRINYQEFEIAAITGLNTFTIKTDTTMADPFVIPVLLSFTPAQVCPVTQLKENIA